MGTDEVSMRRYFEAFGTVEECTVITTKVSDNEPKRSRGFGFAVFETKEEANKVVEQKEHIIDDKSVS